ncbi:golgin-45-like [Saccoglossus kowalevskii]|uniref:Golgin-45-like n=1 Tax=Saccoglossus kowalevskii TaxID=10224 RepID=A0ABM0MC55_SACKO|nr:PREDICTED: golgin-45-like [Saccoglossus kowalevskii]
METHYYKLHLPPRKNRSTFTNLVSSQVIERDIDPKRTPRLEGDGMEYVELREQLLNADQLSPDSSVDLSFTSLLPDIKQSLQDEQLIKIVTLENDVKKLEKERSMLDSKLQEQIKVNKEIKRLLVASVGADLYQQLEDLSRDKLRLAEDLENTIKTLAEERESAQQLGIQCDVWRSKFLGSRVQLDQLIDWKSKSNMMYEEAKLSINKLLNERDEIRTHMMDTNKNLQYLSDALQRSHTLSHDSTELCSNILTLGLINHQLSSTISQHLLGDVNQGSKKNTSKIQSHPVSASCTNYIEWTPAEMMAKDILLNKKIHPACTEDFQSTNSPKRQAMKINRFHPLTNYENLTINCCPYCTGDIKVV